MTRTPRGVSPRDRRPKTVKPAKSPRAAKRPGPGSTDWLEVERLYVQGEFGPAPDGGPPTHRHLSYQDLATRFGLRKATVAERGRTEDWPRKRTTFSQQVHDAADRAVIETVSTEVGRYTERSMRVGDMLLEVAEHRVRREIDRIRHAAILAGNAASDARGASPTVPRSGGGTPGGTVDEEELTTGELRQLAEVHAKVTETRRRELGLEDLILARGKATDPATVVPVNEFSAEVARAVVAARAARNRAPATGAAVTPGSQE